MKKILLLIGIIIALAIIVHAETKERREANKNFSEQTMTTSYETVSMMRDIIDLQERIVKAGEPKKAMLRDLAQLREKTDRLLLGMARNDTSGSLLQPAQTATHAPVAGPAAP
jgi:hypothetical protein